MFDPFALEGDEALGDIKTMDALVLPLQEDVPEDDAFMLEDTDF